MKNMILLIFLLLSTNLFGVDKIKCEELFRSAIFNFYLENSCKFDKHLSSSIRKKFGRQNCTEIYTDDDMKKLNSEVLGQSYKRMKKVGKEYFCKSNKIKYEELAKKYLQVY